MLLRENEVEDVLGRVPFVLEELVASDAIVIWERSGRELLPIFAHGQDSALMLTLRIPVGEGVTGLAAASRTPICANDAHRDPRARQVPGTPVEPESILCLPLLVANRLLGALSLYRAGEGRGFTEAELEVARHFADFAAIAIDNARTHAALETLAQTDDLTGLPNRRRFREQLERTRSSAEREPQPTSLLLLDLDGFKLVNDCHGHDEGDNVLRLVAACLTAATRDDDLVARIGGDEFAILLPQTSLAETEALAARLQTAITATRPGIAACVGIASTEHVPATNLLREADKLLLAAKRHRTQRDTAHDRHADPPSGQPRTPHQPRSCSFEHSFAWLGPV